MSINGKARAATSIEQLLIEMKIKMQVLETRIRERDGTSSLETKPLAGGGGTSGPSGSTGFLRTEGDTMIGPIAYFPKLQQIDTSDGSLNVARDFGEAHTSRVIVSNLTAAPGINFIHGASFAGQVLILQGILTETFTVFNGTGNIRTFDGNDIVVTDNQNVWLIFDSIANEWAAIGAAGGGGGPGGLADPIILNENDIGSIGAGNVQIDWSTHNFHRMELTGDISIQMTNLPAAGKWEQVIVEFTQDALGGHSVTFLDTFANAVTPAINQAANSKTTAIFYAYNDGTNVILAFNVISNFGSVSGIEYGHFSKTANQAAPLTVGTPATFDSIINNSGITIDAAGRISGLRAGHIYECECFMAILNAVNPAACVNFQFHDVANALNIGTHGDAILTGQLATDSAQPSAKAIFSPAADSDTLEVHFTFNNDLVNSFMHGFGVAGTPQSYIMIKDVTGFFGGSGTILAFPNVLINDVVTITAPEAALNIDLAVAQHYVIELDKSITITFTNIPPDIDTSEQIVLEFIQDAIGGHTVSYVDSIDPSVPAISTAALAREVVTGFVRRENAGTYVYNLYLVGN